MHGALLPSFTQLSVIGPLLRLSGPDWPSCILFECLYGFVIAHQFGEKAVLDWIDQIWGNSYYPSGAMNSLEVETTRLRAEDKEKATTKAKHDNGRSARSDHRRSLPHT